MKTIEAIDKESLTTLMPLWLQVAIGIVLGVLAGVFFPHAAVTLNHWATASSN